MAIRQHVRFAKSSLGVKKSAILDRDPEEASPMTLEEA